MAELTKERIEQFIKNPLEHGLTRIEQMEMARQLLAGLEQGPVAVPDVGPYLHGLWPYAADALMRYSEDCRAAMPQGAERPAYEIKGFGMFNAISLDLEGRKLATSIQCFHFERGTVPEHVFNQGIVVKHALQAIINALQLECDGMDDAPVPQIWPMAPQQEPYPKC